MTIIVDRTFAGKTVLITGAGGALGFASAKVLAARGADLVLADLSQTALDQTLAACSGSRGIVCDVTNPVDLERLTGFARETFERPVEGLVAAAGIFGAMKSLIDVSEEEYEAIFSLNVRAIWRICKQIIPQMRQLGRGSVVLLASTAGLQASKDVPIYSVTKAAVVMMARTLALNHAAENIRINCVCPGSISSPMVEGSVAFVKGEAAQAERRANIIAAHPMGRLGLPSEVAAAVAYLLDDAAGFTTGTALPVDGGCLA
ncbi:SDR family oxidoreductase [Mesorhizobium sp. M1312]|uniref:SDR family NAD(P)-dependent oxidoreductase n=1 Tax=unclassified Mesorhizobium TaxID=325217 RepID=UPI00333B493E